MRFQDRLDGFFLGRIDEGTSVDHQDVSFVRAEVICIPSA
jgi:hypothetical protein